MRGNEAGPAGAPQQRPADLNFSDLPGDEDLDLVAGDADVAQAVVVEALEDGDGAGAGVVAGEGGKEGAEHDGLFLFRFFDSGRYLGAGRPQLKARPRIPGLQQTQCLATDPRQERRQVV